MAMCLKAVGRKNYPVLDDATARVERPVSGFRRGRANSRDKATYRRGPRTFEGTPVNRMADSNPTKWSVP